MHTRKVEFCEEKRAYSGELLRAGKCPISSKNTAVLVCIIYILRTFNRMIHHHHAQTTHLAQRPHLLPISPLVPRSGGVVNGLRISTCASRPAVIIEHQVSVTTADPCTRHFVRQHLRFFLLNTHHFDYSMKHFTTYNFNLSN